MSIIQAGIDDANDCAFATYTRPMDLIDTSEAVRAISRCIDDLREGNFVDCRTKLDRSHRPCPSNGAIVFEAGRAIVSNLN
jgi:hypothetical protein